MEKIAFILDWDGTMFTGITPNPKSSEFFQVICKYFNCDIYYLTNNSSRSSNIYRKILQENDLWNEQSEVLTSGFISGIYLKKKLQLTSVYLVGNKFLRTEIKQVGLQHSYKKAEAVIVGYDTTLTFNKIQKAHELIERGIPFFATHDDKTCPSNKGTIVDCGSIIEILRSSSRINPVILGKPYEATTEYLKNITRKYAKCYVIGDRMETDGILAKNLEATFINVTNFTTLSEVSHHLLKSIDHG